MISIGINIGIDETESKSTGIISNLKSVVSPIPTMGQTSAGKPSFIQMLLDLQVALTSCFVC